MESALAQPKDRRLYRRHQPPAAHRIVGAWIRPGYHVVIVNISAGGALLDTLHRLRPGGTVEMHLERTGYRAAIKGHILRCAVAYLEASRVIYRGAIRFDKRLPWLEDDGPGYLVPAEARGPDLERGDRLPRC